jgi:hypothetical protein
MASLGDGAALSPIALLPPVYSGGRSPGDVSHSLIWEVFRPAGHCGSFRPELRQVEAIWLRLAGALLLRKGGLQGIGLSARWMAAHRPPSLAIMSHVAKSASALERAFLAILVLELEAMVVRLFRQFKRGRAWRSLDCSHSTSIDLGCRRSGDTQGSG